MKKNPFNDNDCLHHHWLTKCHLLPNSPANRSLHRSGKEVHNHRIEHSMYGMIQTGPIAVTSQTNSPTASL